MREDKRRRVRHESEPSFIRKTYSIGDTVGIRIHKLDRANTDSNILPCKVLEINKVTDSKSVYKIFSKDGILKTYYSDEDLVDLRTVCFPGLNSIDPNLLLEISHIQACQKNCIFSTICN